MDIVYTLDKKCDGEELRYSLRSLVNMPHDKVFVVGACPRWLKNVIHIPTEQTGTKWQNVPRNLRAVCQDERVSANFIYMNDDFFVTDKVKTPGKELNLYNDTLQALIERAKKNGHDNTPYIRGAWETNEFIKWLGVPEPKSYELHTPMVFNKKKLAKMFELKGVWDIDVLHYRSLYGNLYLSGGQNTQDVKVFIRNGFPPSKPGKFLSCDNGGFFILHNFLFTKFPEKSAYEQ